MPNQAQNSKRRAYDLEERTARFGEAVIDFCGSLERNEINRSLVGQLVRAATSIGANYMEADASTSKKDFEHKIGLCRKESKESMHWLRMVAKANPVKKDECRTLWKEAHELLLIFSTIVRSSRANKLTGHSDLI